MPTVLIPWRGGCPHREAALEWVRERYPFDVRICPLEEGPWVKARAVMPHLRDGVNIIADADVWCEGLGEAVEQVEAGQPWAVPHNQVLRLSRAHTRRVLAGARPSDDDLDQPPYRGAGGGGITVLWREVAEDAPLDPRFEGWGQEDYSWAIALYSRHGPAWRGSEPLFHLWHPPQERMSRKHGNPEGRALHRRYALARRQPEQMNELLEEARDALRTPQPTLHDHPANGRRRA